MKVNRQQTLRNVNKSLLSGNPLLSGHFREGPEGVRLIKVSSVRNHAVVAPEMSFVGKPDCEQRKSSLKNRAEKGWAVKRARPSKKV